MPAEKEKKTQTDRDTEIGKEREGGIFKTNKQTKQMKKKKKKRGGI